MGFQSVVPLEKEVTVAGSRAKMPQDPEVASRIPFVRLIFVGVRRPEYQGKHGSFMEVVLEFKTFDFAAEENPPNGDFHHRAQCQSVRLKESPTFERGRSEKLEWVDTLAKSPELFLDELIESLRGAP
jgi:hypothetical protein